MRLTAFLLLTLALVGCSQEKPAATDAADPNTPTPGGPRPGQVDPKEDKLRAFDDKLSAMGLSPSVPHDLIDREGITVYTPLSVETAPKLLGKITDAGVPFGLDLTITFNSPNRLTPETLKLLKPLPNLHYLNLHQHSIGDGGADVVARFTALRELGLSVNDLTDQGVAKLKGLTKLRSLNLSGNAISDDGLKHLAGLTGLTHLEVGPGTITDAGLKHLAGMRDLTVLNLAGTKVTDAGVAELATNFPKLTRLRLDATGVTDTGLKSLAKLKGLRELGVNSTAVTDAGENTIKAALPDCLVLR